MTDTLTRQLAGLEADVTSVVRLASGQSVRARGDRRRRWWMSRTFTATATILAASGLAVGGVALGTGGRSDPRRAFPATFAMPHEGEPGWVADDSLAVASVFNPCVDPGITLAGRVDARTMSGLAFPDDPAPVDIVEQLFLYRDESAARAVMAKLRVSTDGCGQDGGVYQGSLDLGPDVLWSSAQVSFVQVAEDGVPGPPTRGWRDTMAARYGAAVFILRATGTNGVTPYNEDLAAAQVVRDRLCAEMSICVAPRTAVEPTVAPGVDPAPAPSWWDFLQTPHPLASVPYDPWDRLNPVPTPT
jgi:hypothetical protein